VGPVILTAFLALSLAAGPAAQDAAGLGISPSLVSPRQFDTARASGR
jgi:hypothetical protein